MGYDYDQSDDVPQHDTTHGTMNRGFYLPSSLTLWIEVDNPSAKELFAKSRRGMTPTHEEPWAYSSPVFHYPFNQAGTDSNSLMGHNSHQTDDVPQRETNQGPMNAVLNLLPCLNSWIELVRQCSWGLVIEPRLGMTPTDDEPWACSFPVLHYPVNQAGTESNSSMNPSINFQILNAAVRSQRRRYPSQPLG